jgi:DNA (cytosine-5)-methyltransferase 1
VRNRERDSTQKQAEAFPEQALASVELFAGAGGLALGLHYSGFEHRAVLEWDRHACETIRGNQSQARLDIAKWPLFEADVRGFDYSSVRGPVDLLAGGVPCQPFSIGGKHLGHRDRRNMFPEMIRAVRELKPRAVLVENVRGLTRPAFLKYFSYIELMLTYPDLQGREGENWLDHLGRLERYHTQGKPDGLHYQVVHTVLNAADFGVPQRRERVFFVAIRSDLGVGFSFPGPSHSGEALLWQQFGTGEYWERHEIPAHKRPTLSPNVRTRIDRLRDSFLTQWRRPWRTVRDALRDLPEPSTERTTTEPGMTHFQIPGARAYTGHTGSSLDMPAKTLKAGDHGVPGGENMLAHAKGVRYFTIRESARLQSFPDAYIFPGSWTESMRQLGNAVPVELARAIGLKLRTTLETAIVR